jgi:phenylacetate-CoA ligase
MLGWTRAQLESYQDRRWRLLAGFAVEHTNFYRQHYRGIDLRRAPLSALPPVDKRALMDHFDEAVCDPDLQLTNLRRASCRPGGCALYDGRYHVLSTSGTSGKPGYFVYSQDEWVDTLAVGILSLDLAGMQVLRFPRPRIAVCTTTNSSHISAQLFEAVDLGLMATLVLDPRDSLECLVQRVQRFRPDAIIGYPSVIRPLVEAQQQKLLNIRPRHVICGGEIVTPLLCERIQSVWGSDVFDLYATTETGLLAIGSPDHGGAYILEGDTLVEVVDKNNNSIPAGETGHHVLVTCLQRSAQPVLRYRLSDRLVLAPPLNEHSAPFRRILSMEGRVDDSLRFRTRNGKEVRFNPWFVVDGLHALTGLDQMRVVQDADAITVYFVTSQMAVAGLAAAVEGWFRDLAREHHFGPPRIRVEVVQRLSGDSRAMDKLRPVESRLPEQKGKFDSGVYDSV